MNTDERDEQFRRTFSQKLAEAIRAKDEEESVERQRLRAGGTSVSSTNRSSSDKGHGADALRWERLQSTYVELCHDYPIVSGGDDECRRLAKALIPITSNDLTNMQKQKKNANQKLALCSRLVSGVLQATARAGEKAIVPSSAPSSEIPMELESMFGPSKSTTSEGYSEIAFAIFVEGPYQCIRHADNNDNIQIASSFLGSFEPPELSPFDTTNAVERLRLDDEAIAKIVNGVENMSTEEIVKNTIDTNVHDDTNSSSCENNSPELKFNHDDDSMAEVFAEDSDPDDYEYDSCSNPYSGLSDVEQTIVDHNDNMNDLIFDPLKLSETIEANRTIEGARRSIHYLLSNLSYSTLALGSISSRTWSELGMSETLADLTLILLLDTVNWSRSDTGNSILHSVHQDASSLWNRPLYILRDRALDKKHGHDALPSYLQLLTAFLSHTETKSSLSSSVDKLLTDNCFPPVMSVGISSLAALCSSNEMISASSGQILTTSAWSVCPREEVKNTIMSSLYYLARIVECVTPRKSKFIIGDVNHARDDMAQENSQWMRVIICIIQIVEYLTNLQARFDFQPLFQGGGNRQPTLSLSEAKAISDSGLFREMLSLFTATRTDTETMNTEQPIAVDVVRMQLLRTIFMLSIHSLDLLGQFAVRVPAFANEIHSSEFVSNNLVDGILWASLGSCLQEKASGAANVRPRLKVLTKLKSNAVDIPPNTTNLAGYVVLGFETLCNSTIKALQELKRCIQSSEDVGLSDEHRREYDTCLAALADIRLVSKCFSACPHVTEMLMDALRMKGDAYLESKKRITDIKSILKNLPTHTEDEIDIISPTGHKKDDDANSIERSDEVDPKVQTIKQFRKDYRAAVGSIRLYVKVISLALESQQCAGLLLDQSSKTD